MPVKILIADDHQIVRRGVKNVLLEEPTFEVCGEAANGAEAVQQTKITEPDVILLDLNMPILGGFQAAEQILRDRPTTKVLFYTSHESSYFATEARRIGACGFVSKASGGDSLIRAVQTVVRGEFFFEG